MTYPARRSRTGLKAALLGTLGLISLCAAFLAGLLWHTYASPSARAMPALAAATVMAAPAPAAPVATAIPAPVPAAAPVAAPVTVAPAPAAPPAAARARAVSGRHKLRAAPPRARAHAVAPPAEAPAVKLAPAARPGQQRELSDEQLRKILEGG
jgi:hypothetical protein